jgi:hypothetical protein
VGTYSGRGLCFHQEATNDSDNWPRQRLKYISQLRLYGLADHYISQSTHTLSLSLSHTQTHTYKHTHTHTHIYVYVYIYIHTDRLCGVVVRVLGYRFGGPGSIPCTTRKKVVGLERGPLIVVSTTEELLDRKVAAPV